MKLTQFFVTRLSDCGMTEVMGYRAVSAASSDQRTVSDNEDQTTGSPYEKRDTRQDNSSKTNVTNTRVCGAEPGPIRLTFSTLPSHIREKLLDRQKGKGRDFSWQTNDLRIEFGCVIGAMIWICILFYWTDDYRWTETPVTLVWRFFWMACLIWALLLEYWGCGVGKGFR